MALDFQTFVNPRFDGRGGPAGGQSLFKALGHPIAADRAPALLARLGAARRLAVYDPFGQAAIADQLYRLAEFELAGVFVQRVEELQHEILGRRPRLITELSADDADLLLIAAFDADRLAAQIAPFQPASLELASFDDLRLPDDMLSDRRNYLAPINFANNFAFFRDQPDQHTAIVTVNYWSLYGAKDPALWCRLFAANGEVLAEWRETLPPGGGGIRIDSRVVRERFGLGDFCGSLFLHAINAYGHDVVKYALDVFGDSATTLSCSHDANAWPADRYAGLPAPADGERVLLWVQNSHPVPIPAGGIGLNAMGDDDIAWFDQEIPPFGTRAIDCGALLPGTTWPRQLEVQAGKYFVRPRYEIIKGNGRRRIAHANVERNDLAPDPSIAANAPLLGKGYIMPLPIPPLERFTSVALPTPMATEQRVLPIRALLIDASGEQIDERYLGVVRRDESRAVSIDDWLAELATSMPSGYGHLEFVYDFRESDEADGWLHAIGRYEDRANGHAAETSFGAHIFNTAITFRDEPQSYSGPPPGLSTRLFLRLGIHGLDAFCHLIYPASRPWRETSRTDLNLVDNEGEIVASRRVEIPCGGSLFWRQSETFSSDEMMTAGANAYVQVRDTTCRLFGYHGLMAGTDAFSLDHMFGF